MQKNSKFCNCAKSSAPLFAYRNHSPDALAVIKGDDAHPEIYGVAKFYAPNTGSYGVIVETEVQGLPHEEGKCKQKVFAMHIHSGSECSGNENDPFANAKTHYNPYGCEHPHHAGDMPPLFENNGYALSVFFTNRFTVDEIKGKTVIIHDMADDFTTQPAGNSGSKIACGQIH